MIKIYFASTLVFLSVLGLSAGCTTVPVSSSLPTQRSPLPPKTLPPTWTPTFTMTATATLTPSGTPYPTMTLTRTPSLTPIPTLEKEAAQEKIHYMLYENDNCKFPCWWDIIPGETTLDYLNNEISSFVRTTKRTEGVLPNTTGPTFVRTDIFYEFNNVVEPNNFAVFSVDGIVQGTFLYRVSNLTLSGLLEELGIPEEVFLRTEPASPTDSFPFDVILFYPSKDTYVSFYSPYGGRLNGSYVSICPQYVSPILYLGIPLAEQEVINYLGAYHVSTYKPVETASGLSVEQFYEIYIDTDANVCISTLAQQWWLLED